MIRPGGSFACAAALVVLAAAATAGARPGDGQEYSFEARLDPGSREVRAHGRIAWRNDSARPVHELYFHLYPNAFAHRNTVFMREGGASIRGGALERWGGLDVERLVLQGQPAVDLRPRADTALVKDDATQMRVPLPRAVAPGERIVLEVAFRVRLPSLLARMGSSGDFFMVAQWFPKLARLEPDGRWASFPYHGLGEFYADFADYDVAIELPDEFVVAAPGRRLERRRLPGGFRRERYALRAALDFAFAANPDLRRVQRRAAGVQIEVYAPPGHTALAARQAELLGAGLARLGARLGPYAYDRLVLVLPEAGAHGAAGMEYPGLITGWSAGATTHLDPRACPLHDFVTSHELAHQWFPLLVASNEVQHPVLDEGLAEWLAFELVRGRHGRGSLLAAMLGAPVDPFELTRIALHRTRATPSSLLPAHAYRPSQLAPAVYLRPALALESISRAFGPDRLWAALGRYARAHRFAHVRPADLWAAFDAEYGRGFAERVLRPALEGRTLAGELPAGHDLLARRPAAPPRGGRAAPQPPLLSRLVLWTQTLLGVLGP